MRTLMAAIVVSTLLVACGGGGDSGGSAAPPAASLSITSANQDAVARASAVTSTALLGGGSNVSATGGSSPQSVQGSIAARSGGSITALALHAARMLIDPKGGRRHRLSADTAQAVRTLAIAPPPTPCKLSGFVTTAFTDTDNSGSTSAGDTLTFTFDECRETASGTTGGVIELRLGSVTDLGNGLASFAGTLTMNQVKDTAGARVTTLNGSFGMTYLDHTATEAQITLTVGSGGLTASVQGGGLSDSVSLELGFKLDETDTIVPGGVDFSSASLSGGLSATSIGGRVQLEQVVPLLQQANEAYPRAGTLRVVGSGSALRLQALNATTARIDLDTNLDGTYESSKDVPWTTLLPS
jgi:hypothetical protein